MEGRLCTLENRQRRQKRFDHRRGMDFFENSYYSVNRLSLLSIGQWPFDRSRFRFVQRATICAAFVLFANFQMARFVTSEYSMDLLIEVLHPLIICTIIAAKYCTYWANTKIVGNLLEHIRYEWCTTHTTEEWRIVKRYAKEMRSLARFYISMEMMREALALGKSWDTTIISIIRVYAYFTLAFIYIMPAQKLLDSSSEVFHKAYSGRWYAAPVASQKILLFVIQRTMKPSSITIAGTLTISYEIFAVWPFDRSRFRFVQRATICAAFVLFANFQVARFVTAEYSMDLLLEVLHPLIICTIVIVKYFTYWVNMEIIRTLLEHIRNDWCMTYDETEQRIMKRYGKEMRSLARFYISMEMMREALASGKDWDIIIISVIRVYIYFVLAFIHCLSAQKLLDTSSDVFYKAYCSRWYAAPVKSQKILLFIIQRTMKPSSITIANSLTISCESFATVLKFFTTEITVDLVVDILPHMLLCVITGIRYFAIAYNTKNLVALLDYIEQESNALAKTEEIELLRMSYEEARSCGQIYICKRFRLEHLFDEDSSDFPQFLLKVADIVEYHNNVIRYIQEIVRNFAAANVTQIGLIVLILTSLLLQLHRSLQPLEDMEFVVLNVFRIISHFIMVFLNVLPGQKLLDQSGKLFVKA
ncbi:hypothetical protein KM043_007913 [Ampulex compressa]|nr:hypothetical protein KM043_007913 [Ampulex compressa]